MLETQSTLLYVYIQNKHEMRVPRSFYGGNRVLYLFRMVTMFTSAPIPCDSSYLLSPVYCYLIDEVNKNVEGENRHRGINKVIIHLTLACRYVSISR